MSTDSTRLAGKPWWQMPIGGSPQHWREHGMLPEKGQYGGECARIACDVTGAHWFNDTNGKYYCSSCARTFNEVSRRNGQEPLCELHPAPRP
jgi:hypothetical protein